MKKFIVVLLGVVLIFSSLSFVGCELPKETYSFELEIQLSTETERINQKIKQDQSYLEINPLVSSDDRARFCPILWVVNSKGHYLDRTYIHNFFDEWGGDFSYTITDDDGNIENGNIYRNDIHLTKSSLESGNVYLEQRCGVHRLTYTTPALEKYNLESTKFELVLNFEEDTRTRTEKLELLNPEKVELVKSAEQTGKYDVYVMYDEPEYVVKDTETGAVVNDVAILVVRKLNESYIESYFDERVIETFYEDGIYLCKVITRGTEEHKRLVYYFYAIHY